MNHKLQVRIVLLVIIGAALTWLMAEQRLFADIEGAGTVPALISFQGLLADSNGDPLADGSYDMAFAIYDAASGGTLIWAETQNGVMVSNGFFAVMLGSGLCTSGCPLGADDFTGAARYLQTSVDTGGGLVDFPRQQLASAPYAFQAESAPWSGLTDVPPGFADGIDNGEVYTAGVGLELSGNTFALLPSYQLPQSCAADQIALWDGAAWVCADGGGGAGGGDITAVTAGDGLTGGGTTGAVTLAADFGGNGSANTVSRSDHLHDDRYYTEIELQTSGAAAVHWNNLSNVPPGFADGTDDGSQYENVITVAISGGDFTSVAAALASITDSSSSNRYLVRVMAGVFTETDLVEVKEYVHVQGSGPNATVVTSARTGGTPGNAAATIDLLENSAISDLTVRNTGTGTYAIALYSALTTRATHADNILAEANGAGGTGHYAVYLNDAEVTIQDSILRASGATGFGTGVNAALGIVNISGGFPQPLIKGSVLIGGNSDIGGITCAGNTGTGFAIQGTSSSPQVFESYLCGDRRAVFMGTQGNTRLHHSQLWVSSTTGSFMVETTGTATVLIVNSGVFYVANKYTGTGGFVCVNSYKSNYTPATDGTTSGTACN